MRNPINVLKSIEEKACNSKYRYERLYRNLYNSEFYLLAYKNIATSQGSMTAGTDGMTLDEMSTARINRTIAKLKDHSYQPNPARREYIEKKNSTKKRPLGIPSTDDKLVQEVVRMILEAMYEPTFSKRSHGFRPNRSCHTALLEVKTTFHGTKWIIEGDIKACFDSFDHKVLIDILRRRIQDEYFISLMWKFLKAGYMEQYEYHTTYSGTPQGSGISPILANIYLNELDKFMTEYANDFNTGNRQRKLSHEYQKARWKFHSCKLKLENSKNNPKMVKMLKQAQQEMLKTPSFPTIDPGYKRIQYNRYADDFIIGIIGSKNNAEKVKADIKQFLQDKLKLTLSEEKTKVTHSSDLVRYLGYDLTVSRNSSAKRNSNGDLRRVWNGCVRLYVPKEKWVNKLNEYKAYKVFKDESGNETWKPIHRKDLINRPEIDIISKYNSEIRGIYNYYKLADNVSVLHRFFDVMKRSMFKTFAAKYSSTVSKIKKTHMKDGIFKVKYETKSGIKWCELHHDGFCKSEKAAMVNTDVLPQYRKYDKPNSMAVRLKLGICELCGKKTGNILMHHVRRLKDLTGQNEWELLMAKKRRKTLALCPVCNEKVHARVI